MAAHLVHYYSFVLFALIIAAMIPGILRMKGRLNRPQMSGVLICLALGIIAFSELNLTAKLWLLLATHVALTTHVVLYKPPKAVKN